MDDEHYDAGVPATDSPSIPELRPGEAVLVSACLLGEAVRYSGDSNPDPALVAALEAAGARIVPVCPEVLGGLGVPRPPAEPPHGDGVDVLAGRAPVRTVGGEGAGRDVSAEYLRGARLAVELAREVGARFAFLKERSPSCGVERTHSGGGLVDGPGVATAALREAGVVVLPAKA